MRNILLPILLTVAVALIGYILFTGQKKCQITVKNPFNGCLTDTTIKYNCVDLGSQTIHFVSSGNLKLAGSTQDAQSTVPANEQVFEIDRNCYMPFVDQLKMRLTGDFYIIAPCYKIPDAFELTNGSDTFNAESDTIGGVSLMAKVFRNGWMMEEADIKFTRVKNYTEFESLNADFDIKFDDYSYLCINDTARCAAVIRLRIDYMMEETDTTDKYHLVFYAEDHHEDYHEHDLEEIVSSGCFVPEMVFFSERMRKAHEGFFTKEEIEEAIKNHQAAKEMNRLNILTDTIDLDTLSPGTVVAECYEIENYEFTLEHYQCLEDKTDCHVSDHIAIIELPRPCPVAIQNDEQ